MSPRRYSRDDVERYYDRGTEYPSINVKVWPDNRRIDRAYIAWTIGDDDQADTFLAWLEEWEEDDANSETAQTAWDWACEDGYEQATDIARKVFDERGIMVFALGRSGGHLCVEGLPDIDDWDAIALGKWRSYATQVEAIRRDTDTRYAVLVLLNIYDH